MTMEKAMYCGSRGPTDNQPTGQQSLSAILKIAHKNEDAT
jgi:hypothetical protein